MHRTGSQRLPVVLLGDEDSNTRGGAHLGSVLPPFRRRRCHEIEGDKADAPRPDLILLDLNLPKMNGHQVLALIKADENLKTIPTVILTTSTDEKDIRRSYELSANSFLSKPVELAAFEALVKNINDYWLNNASLKKTWH